MGAEDGPSDGEDEFIWGSERAAGSVPQPGPFPPDEVLDPPWPLSFARILAALVVVGAAVDAALVGYPYTGIPYNYPAIGGVAYGLLAILILRRTHDALDMAAGDLVAIARRTAADAVLRPREVDADAVVRETEALRHRAFHPAVLLGGAAIGAGIALWAVFRLGLTAAYPYLVVTAIYGAAHGLFVAPAVGVVVIGYRTADRYAVGFDALAPDGAGGYRRIGRSFARVITDGIVLLTFDLVVLASVGYARPWFLSAVLGAYGLSLSLLLALAVAWTVATERRLRRVRSETAAAMRGRLDEAMTRFWGASARDEDPRPAADALRTMAVLFERLERASLWPLGRWSVARVIAAAALSLAVAAAVVTTVPGAL